MGLRLAATVDDRVIEDTVREATIIDGTGFTADSCSLAIDNRDGLLEAPEMGMTVKLAIDLGEGFEDIGSEYTIAGVIHTETDLYVSAKSIDVTSTLKTVRSGAYQATTIGQVFREVASKNNLNVLISPGVSALPIFNDVVQAKETDLNFLTRITRKYDCYFKQIKGKIAFGLKSEKLDFLGTPLDPILIFRDEIEAGWTFTRSAPDRYTSAKADYYDLTNGSKESIVVGDESGEQLVIKEPFGSEAEAKHKAEAELKKYKGRDKTLSLTLPKGKPACIAEGPFIVTGLRGEVDGQYIASRVTHSIKNGLRTTLEARSDEP
jgi:phage protein D